MENFNSDNPVGMVNARVQQLTSLVQKGNSKYFHLKSLQNFAAHLSEITSANDRGWIATQLIEYCDYCLEHFQEIDNLTKAKALYFTYLSKVAEYYGRHINFSLLLGPIYLSLMYAILFAVMWFFLKWYLALGISLVLFILHFFYILQKENKGRTFQLYY